MAPLLFLLFFLQPVASASDCSCTYSALSERIKAANQIFVGEMTGSTSAHSGRFTFKTGFKVVRALKGVGDRDDVSVIHDVTSRSSCGHTFDDTSEWLIFLDREGKAKFCTPTMRFVPDVTHRYLKTPDSGPGDMVDLTAPQIADQVAAAVGTIASTPAEIPSSAPIWILTLLLFVGGALAAGIRQFRARKPSK